MKPLASPIAHEVLGSMNPGVVLAEIDHVHHHGMWSNGIPVWAQDISDRTFGIPEEGSWQRRFEFVYVEKQLLLWLIDKAYEETA